jgi:hypothetical protein
MLELEFFGVGNFILFCVFCYLLLVDDSCSVVLTVNMCYFVLCSLSIACKFSLNVLERHEYQFLMLVGDPS